MKKIDLYISDSNYELFMEILEERISFYDDPDFQEYQNSLVTVQMAFEHALTHEEDDAPFQDDVHVWIYIKEEWTKVPDELDNIPAQEWVRLTLDQYDKAKHFYMGDLSPGFYKFNTTAADVVVMDNDDLADLDTYRDYYDSRYPGLYEHVMAELAEHTTWI